MHRTTMCTDVKRGWVLGGMVAAALLLVPPQTLAQDAAIAPAQASFEKQFLVEMPHHHQMGVEAFQVCQQKAQHSELKGLCQKMTDAQQNESKQMEAWRQSWYQGQGSMPEKDMTRMMAQQKSMMAKLNAATGNAFDHTFLQMTIQHHEQGVAKAKACEAKAGHAELKDLCQKMAKDQQEEIGQMQHWMHDWSQGGAH